MNTAYWLAVIWGLLALLALLALLYVRERIEDCNDLREKDEQR